jgi:hypothetical protein
METTETSAHGPGLIKMERVLTQGEIKKMNGADYLTEFEIDLNEQYQRKWAQDDYFEDDSIFTLKNIHLPHFISQETSSLSTAQQPPPKDQDPQEGGPGS